MLYVSLIFEFLLSRPRVMFWAAALGQTLLWTLVPSLFYAAPPGDLPFVLAVGHQWQLGTVFGPPLAFWLAEGAFALFGGSIVGVYVLAQLCVLVALWAVFTFGRALFGTAHAVLAVLLMAGIAAYSVPTPEFGPALLAVPLWALAILFYWRAVGEGRRAFWFALGIVAGLLLLTAWWGLLLLKLLGLFTLVTARGRAALRTPAPWLAAGVMLVIVAPYAIWMGDARALFMPALTLDPALIADPRAALPAILRNLVLLLVAHAGFVVLLLVASGRPFARAPRVATIERQPAPAFGLRFVYFLAWAPAVIASIVAAMLHQSWTFATVGPLVLASGLAAIALAGPQIRLHRQRVLSGVWLGLLAGMPLAVAVGLGVLPWLAASDLKVLQPAQEIGRFFTESFQRRTGRPLAVVTGDTRIAALIALQRERPALYLIDRPWRSPWTDAQAIARDGAVVVWPALDTQGTPPPDIKARFPDLVIEVPRTFDRLVQGRLSPIRIGWSVIRPQGAAAPAAP